MSIEANCPGCGTKVRVPESLLRKRVKCPKCSQIFVAEDPNAAYEEMPDAEQRPGPKRRPAPVDDYDDEDQYDNDDYEQRPRRGRGYRRLAEEAVKGPAIALMIVGFLGLGYAVVNLLVVMGGADPFHVMANKDPAHRFGAFLGIGLTFIWAIVVPFAGFKMMTLRSYSAVMTGVIFGMVPCNAGCLLGVPFGIWALVVLNRPEVKRSFT